MVINCTCLHVLSKCVSEAMVTGAHTCKYSIKWCYWQARSWSKRLQSKMELQTVSKFLCSSHWTHSWSTPHKTIPNKEPRVYDCTWNLQHKWEQYWWQAPPPWSHQQASHLWDLQFMQVSINCYFLRLGISQQAPTNHWHTQSWSSFPRTLKECRIYWQDLQRSTESWAIDKLLLLGEVQI